MIGMLNLADNPSFRDWEIETDVDLGRNRKCTTYVRKSVIADCYVVTVALNFDFAIADYTSVQMEWIYGFNFFFVICRCLQITVKLK